MTFRPLRSGPGGRRQRRQSSSVPARPVPDPANGVPLDPSAVKSVIEPAPTGSWVLKIRSVQAATGGSASQWAFYTAASREAHLAIHTASAEYCERSLEQDEARLRRDVNMFDVQAGLGMEMAARLQRGLPLRAEPTIGSWSDGTITVDGNPAPIRLARAGDRGWVGYFTCGNQVIEIHSDALPASQIALVQIAAGEGPAD
jgi:hypothetical protein